TTISAEVEADTLGLLRLTNMPSRQITLAKFSAAMQQIKAPVIAVILTRFLFLIGLPVGVLLLLLVYSSPVAGGGSAPLPDISSLNVPAGLVASYLIAVGIVLVFALLLAVYYLVSPILEVAIFASVGLFASTWARTRTGGLLTAVGARVVLGAVSYLLSQMAGVIVQLLMLPLMLMPALPLWAQRFLEVEPAILLSLGGISAILSLLLIAAGQAGLSLLVLYITSRRVSRLPYG
nr:hypothetical protein [Anaerolineae bacterium]